MPRPSGTCAMPSATISCGATPVIDVPASRTVPRDGRTSPEIARRVVVLPAPFAPISVTTWPSSTEKLTPLSAWMPP